MSKKDDDCFSIAKLLRDIKEIKQEWGLVINSLLVDALLSTWVLCKELILHFPFIVLLQFLQPFYDVKWLAMISIVVLLFGIRLFIGLFICFQYLDGR